MVCCPNLHFLCLWLLSGIVMIIALIRGEQKRKRKLVRLLPGSTFEQRRRMKLLP